MEDVYDEELFGVTKSVKRKKDESVAEEERQIDIIHPQSEVFQDLRRHYGKIINTQSTIIRLLSKKLEILKIVVGVLLFLTILIKLSSCYCGENPEDTVSIQQSCMNQKSLYNCDKDKNSNPHWKICE